jgi:hypothetical protein
MVRYSSYNQYFHGFGFKLFLINTIFAFFLFKLPLFYTTPAMVVLLL